MLTIPFIKDFQDKHKKTDNNVIEFWQYWTGKEGRAIETLVERFNAEDNGMQVKLLTISMPQKKYLMSMIAKVPPDLILVDSFMLSDFAPRGALTDLSTIFKPADLVNFRENLLILGTLAVNKDRSVSAEFIGEKAVVTNKEATLASDHEKTELGVDTIQQVTNLKDLNRSGQELDEQINKIYLAKKITASQDKLKNLYALPIMPTVEAMHINTEMLKRYDLKEPKTLADLIYINEYITQKSNFKEFGWMPAWPSWTSRVWVRLFGGGWTETLADGSQIVTANRAENIQAWNWMNENFIAKTPTDKLRSFSEGIGAYQSPENPFYSGKIAIETSGIWEYNLARIYVPDLKIKVKTFPSYENKYPLATTINADMLAVPADSKKKQLSYKFIKWLTQQQQLEELALKQGKITSLKSQSNKFIQKHPHPDVETFIKLSASVEAQPFAKVPYGTEYKREIQRAFENVIRGDRTVKQALDELQMKISKISLQVR
jgi:multiple sugar transport system substrate-binding protein